MLGTGHSANTCPKNVQNLPQAPAKTNFWYHPLTFWATPPACCRSLSGPSGPKCPGSVPGGVQKVSRECPRSVRDTFLTLRDTLGTLFGALRGPGPEGPHRHPEGHSWDTSGPKGPRDSCSRLGALQWIFLVFFGLFWSAFPPGSPFQRMPVRIWCTMSWFGFLSCKPHAWLRMFIHDFEPMACRTMVHGFRGILWRTYKFLSNHYI